MWRMTITDCVRFSTRFIARTPQAVVCFLVAVPLPSHAFEREMLLAGRLPDLEQDGAEIGLLERLPRLLGEAQRGAGQLGLAAEVGELVLLEGQDVVRIGR